MWNEPEMHYIEFEDAGTFSSFELLARNMIFGEIQNAMSLYPIVKCDAWLIYSR